MSRRIRRLLFVTDAPHFGGAEQYILSMCRAARAQGIEPCIQWLPTAGSRSDAFAAAEAEKVRIETDDFTNATRAVGCSRAKLVGGVTKLLRSFGPDAAIINASGRPGFWLVPWLTRRAGVPSAWVHHMVDTRDHRRNTPRRLGGRLEGLQSWRVPQMLRHRLAAAAADRVIVSNARDRDWLLRWQRVPRERLHVLPPGIDGQRFRPDAARQIDDTFACDRASCVPFVLGTAARLVRGKGIERIIEAAAILRRQGVPIAVLIAGDGPDASSFEELALKLGVADAVRFLGRVDNMPAFYRRLDAFAMCSDTESFGLAITEAMACELPVIATPTAGARSQINHGQNGWLLQSFEVAELAGALAELRSDISLRRRLGSAARGSVLERFSIEQTFDRTLQLLQPGGIARTQAPEAARPASILSIREVA
jgi:glycosyltransferase involved in cell wall biosynthesis